MIHEDRLNILEQTLKERRLSLVEEEELYELLEMSDRLDSWLDNNGVITPSTEEKIIYDDKEFLKSICESPIHIELEMPLTYQNKEKLYRKSNINYILKITSSVAAVAMLIWFVTEPKREIDLKVDMPSTISQNSKIEMVKAIKKIEQIKVIKKVISIEKVEITTKSVNSKDANVEIEVESIKEDRYIAIKTSSTLKSKIDIKVACKRKITEQRVIEIQVTPSEIILYADATKWEERKKTAEIIIHHEEWTSSENHSKQRLKGFVSKLTNKYKQI